MIRLAYVLVFGVAALGCLDAIGRARQVADEATSRGLVALLGLSGVWALANVGLFLVPGVAAKTVVYEAGLVAGFTTVFAWLYFCSAYTNRPYHREPRYRWAGVAVLAAVVAVKLTNPIHGWYFQTTFVSTPFPHLAIQHGLAHWVATGLAYTLATVGMFMLVEAFEEAGYDTRALVGLVGLTALPVAVDLVAYNTDALVDVIYAPLGVAAFAVGVLYVAEDRFLAVQLTGPVEGPVVLLDEDGRIRDYNRAARDLLPALEGATGDHLSTLPGFESADPDRTVLQVERGDETAYYLVSESEFTVGQSAIGRVLVFTDVTRIERQRRELARHNEQLESFSTGVRHELLNALQVVDGRVSAAGSALDAGDVSEARNLLSTAASRAESMTDVVDSLTTLARFGQTVEETEPVDFAAACEAAWASADTDGTTLSIERGGTLAADEPRLRELLETLFGFLAANGATEVRVALAGGRVAVETDWSPPPGLDSEGAFEYGGGLPDTDTWIALPKVRTLARVHGWSVALERRDDGVRLTIDDVTTDPDVRTATEPDVGTAADRDAAEDGPGE